MFFLNINTQKKWLEVILNKHRMPEVKNTFIGLNTNWTSRSIHFLLKFLYKYTAFK